MSVIIRIVEVVRIVKVVKSYKCIETLSVLNDHVQETKILERQDMHTAHSEIK